MRTPVALTKRLSWRTARGVFVRRVSSGFVAYRAPIQGPTLPRGRRIAEPSLPLSRPGRFFLRVAPPRFAPAEPLRVSSIFAHAGTLHPLVLRGWRTARSGAFHPPGRLLPPPRRRSGPKQVRPSIKRLVDTTIVLHDVANPGVLLSGLSVSPPVRPIRVRPPARKLLLARSLQAAGGSR